MKKKKLSKQQLREKQKIDDKKFKKYLRNGVLIGFTVVVLIQIFFVHWCDTRYFFRKHYLYGNEVSPDLVCETENVLKHHKTDTVRIDKNTFWVCSSKCKHHIVKHNQQHAYTIDAFSGDSICKAGAVIGLKEKGKPELVYFKNQQTFKKYYKKNK